MLPGWEMAAAAAAANTHTLTSHTHTCEKLHSTRNFYALFSVITFPFLLCHVFKVFLCSALFFFCQCVRVYVRKWLCVCVCVRECVSVIVFLYWYNPKGCQPANAFCLRASTLFLFFPLYLQIYLCMCLKRERGRKRDEGREGRVEAPETGVWVLWLRHQKVIKS